MLMLGVSVLFSTLVLLRKSLAGQLGSQVCPSLPCVSAQALNLGLLVKYFKSNC